MTGNSQARPPTGRVFDAKLHLLDRQVLDVHGRMVCKVDDLELTGGEGGRLYVSAILAGPIALGPRVGGWLGQLMVAVGRRLSPLREPDAPRIDFRVVTDIGSAVRIGVPAAETRVRSLEDWMRENIVARVPGASHAPE